LPVTTVTVSLRQNTFIVSVDANVPKNLYDQGVAAAKEGFGKLQGIARMADPRPRRHELAAAIAQYAQEKKHFPRGAAERTPPQEPGSAPWPPEQRVGWMAEILPYLSPESASVTRGITPNQSWRDGANLAAAGKLVPEFLAPEYAEATRWTTHPGLEKVVTASTHFVGVAGVGLDAARFRADDPDAAKKLGVFGFDRVTGLDQVTDGLGATIVAIQVPAGSQRPWLAGGAATVVGVPEADSVKPFVCVTLEGRRGTFALMGDGKVRFVSETISDADFKALCTIAGGEAVDVDRVAPEVKRPGPGASGRAPPNAGVSPPPT
jgi:hypothetical protein